MTVFGWILAAFTAYAQATAPDVFVRQLSESVIDAVKSDRAIQGGDLVRIRQLVDGKIVPYVDIERMTSAAVGPQWRSASVEQKRRLQGEFKTLLINTYSGALTQVRDQTVTVKPSRSGGGSEVQVRTEVKGSGEPIPLDYRLEKSGNGWRIYDLNVGGFWIVDAYRGQFAQDLVAGGFDALIARLAQKNKATNRTPRT